MRISFTNKIVAIMKHCLIAIVLLATATGCVVTAPDQALYDASLIMATTGQKEKAYSNIRALCIKYPTEKKICAEESALRIELYNENMNFVKSKLDVEPPVSKSVISATEQKLNNALKYGNTAETSKYSARLAEYRDITNRAVADAKADSDAFNASGNFIAAYEAVAGVKELDSALLGPLADEYGDKAISKNLPEAEKLIAEDDMKEAKELLSKLVVIAPDNDKIKQFLELAQKNDNPDYYMSKGTASRDNGELERALKYYMKALAFPDARQEAQKLVDETRVQIAEVSFMKGVEFAGQELNKQAYDSFVSAFNTMKSIPIEARTMVAIPKDELEQYYDNMFFAGQKAMDEGAYGKSYLYLNMLYNLIPSYHGLRELKKSVEDKVLARALKSIAVIPFKSPVSEPELGLQVTSNIMQILQNSLSDDVKIIERGALEILLREYELAVAGSAEQQTSTDSFRIKSADYLLMGDVLDSRTETNIQNSKKKVRVKVSENKIRNIEWEDWAREAEALRKQNRPIPREPVKYIQVPVYDYAEYDVAFHEKVSYLSISYRVVETSQGRVTYSNTVRAQKEARDEATSGIDIGTYKIDMKAANLPTDIELSNEVRKETIDKISNEVMEIFKDQDEKYLAEAEKLETSNNIQAAVEMYVNAILLKIRKNKDVTEIEDKAGKYLDVLSAY